jgi:hypothetical protein
VDTAHCLSCLRVISRPPVPLERESPDALKDDRMAGLPPDAREAGLEDFAMAGIARPRERPAVFRFNLSRAILQQPRIRGAPVALAEPDSRYLEMSEEEQ